MVVLFATIKHNIQYIHKMSALITYEKARELSIKKWEFLANNPLPANDNDLKFLTDTLPELKDLLFLCGFCEYTVEHYGMVMEDHPNCSFCPLWKKYNPSKPPCIQSFQVWQYHPTEGNAQLVLDDILNMPENEKDL